MTDEDPTEASVTPPAKPSAPHPAKAALPPDDISPATPAEPRSSLPGNVTAAAIVLLIFGTLSALGSALAILWSLLLVGRMGMGFDRFGGGFGDGGGSFGGGFGATGFLFGVLAVALAAAIAGGHLAAGWAVLQRLAWGRILGMVVAGAALTVVILSMLGTLVWVATLPDLSEFDRVPGWFEDWFRSLMTAGVGFGVIVSLLVAAAYGYVLWVLARAGEVFD